MKLCRGLAFHIGSNCSDRSGAVRASSDVLCVYDLGEELEIFGDAVFKIRSDYPSHSRRFTMWATAVLSNLGRVTEGIYLCFALRHGLFNEARRPCSHCTRRRCCLLTSRSR